MKRIAVDMDGVLADCYQQFVNYAYAETGIRKTLEAGLGKSEYEAFEQASTYLHQPGFFRTMPVIRGSQQVLAKLNEVFEVFIVSAATEFPLSLPEKQAWLNEHFPFIKWQQMIFCGLKTPIDADIMIDDHFKNLDHFKGSTILYSQPHNALACEGRHQRVQNWMEIEHLLLHPYLLGNYKTSVAVAPVISKYA